MIASANEAVAVTDRPDAPHVVALDNLAHRHIWALGMTAKDLHAALRRAPDHGSEPMHLDEHGPPTLSDGVALPAGVGAVPPTIG